MKKLLFAVLCAALCGCAIQRPITQNKPVKPENSAFVKVCFGVSCLFIIAGGLEASKTLDY